MNGRESAVSCAKMYSASGGEEKIGASVIQTERALRGVSKMARREACPPSRREPTARFQERMARHKRLD